MSEKKSQQLGMSYGKAGNILRKNIIFNLAHKCGMGSCYQCGNPIDDINNFSIEHKEPWLDTENPIELFFDIENIAFSHMACNFGARRRPEVHPTQKDPIAYAGKRVGKSGYKGVSEVKGKSHKYHTFIRYEGKNIHIKYGNDATELAKLFDAKAIELFGEDAITNAKLGLL